MNENLYGNINVRTHLNNGQLVSLSYTLEGGPLFRISRPLLDDGDPARGFVVSEDYNTVRMGGLRFTRLVWDDSQLVGIYYLENPYGVFVSKLWKLSQWVERIYKSFYHRLILTLGVWNLAESNPATVPSWRDIKVFRNAK